MCKLTEFFTKITSRNLFFLCCVGLQVCFILPLFSQINNFPYYQSFEDSFKTGEELEFLPHWWGNEVREGSSRIYQAGLEEAYSGKGSLALVPTSSFQPEIRISIDAGVLDTGFISFRARSLQNGSGSRSSQLKIAFSADGGESFTAEVQPAGEAGFANAHTPYRYYELAVPREILESEEVLIKLQVERMASGEGTAAIVLLDDFRIASETQGFRLLEAQTVGDQQVVLLFNHPPAADEAVKPSYYQIDKGIVVKSARLDVENPKKVWLETSSLEAGTSYTLTLGALPDREGRSAEGQQATFVFEDDYQLQTYDLLISEIHAAPGENTLLPHVEWVELYNTSGRSLFLEGLSFGDPGRIVEIPSARMEAGGFLLLAPAADAGELEEFGPVAGLSSWPNLNNGGDELSIYDSGGKLIDRVNYHESWYGNNEKASGGWSLERIDLQNPCIGGANWSASVNSSGGTPGAANSTAAEKPDLWGPKLKLAFAYDSVTIFAEFNEALDTTLLSLSRAVLEPEVSIKSLKVHPEKPLRLIVVLQKPMDGGHDYFLYFEHLFDCSGNELQQDFSTAKVAFPEPAVAGDLVFNELMYDPSPESEEWVEVANASAKHLDLNGWQLATYSGGIKKTVVLSRDHLVVSPGALLVLSRHQEKVRNAFPSVAGENLLQLNGLPALANEGDTLVLMDGAGSLIEKFGYHPGLHAPFIRDAKGVSLERISWEAQSNEGTNWTSAAAHAGYGTPGKPNSQRFRGEVGSENTLLVEPQLILPAGMGQDFAGIYFKGGRPGLQATLRIIDNQGREIRQLAVNESLGTEAFFSWDGTKQDRQRVRSGYYIVFLEVFDATGYQQYFRETVVVAN